MGKLDAYKLPLKSLPEGTHQYEYQLDTNWFTLIDGPEVQKGNVNAQALVKNTGYVYEIHLKVEGTVQVPCDRCLDDMPIEIAQESRLFVKFGSEYREESEEVIIIPEADGELNIAWFLYEMIALAIPMKHVHLPGQCNKTMVKKLQKHTARRSQDDDSYDGYSDSDYATYSDSPEDSFEEDSFEEEEESRQQTNPIWDELKKLNLTDNN